MLGNGDTYKPQTAGTYRLVFASDPAVRQPVLPSDPGPDADDDARAEVKRATEAAAATYREAWRVARETDEWKPMLVDGESPTYFVCQWIPREAWRRWSDLRRENGGSMGDQEAESALVRLALVGIENLNWPGFSFPRPIYDGELRDNAAPRALFDELRRIRGLDVDRLIGFLAGQIYAQEVAARPL